MGQRDEKKKRDSKCERDFINLVGFEDGRNRSGYKPYYGKLVP